MSKGSLPFCSFQFLVVFEEYLRATSALSVLFQKEYFDLTSVQRYLKSKPEFAWMVDIKNRNYENVSNTHLIKCRQVSSFRELGFLVHAPASRRNHRQTSSTLFYHWIELQWLHGFLCFLQTLLAISKFALLASGHHEIRNAEAIKLRLRFIENEENLCQQRLDLLSNVSTIEHRRNKETHVSLLLVG